MFDASVFAQGIAPGGNCANKCASAVNHYEPCLVEHNCRADNTTCSSDCQECIDDVYSACGGCSQNDWDTASAPSYKNEAESMGCSSVEQVVPLLSALTVVISHFLS